MRGEVCPSKSFYVSFFPHLLRVLCLNLCVPLVQDRVFNDPLKPARTLFRGQFGAAYRPWRKFV